MPEGDTIHKLAAAMGPDLVDRTLEAVELGPEIGGAERLRGQVVREVSARGKHLLITVQDGWTLRSWMGMNGKWHRYAAQERWRKPQWRAKATLRTDRHCFVCFDPPQVEVLHERELAVHPTLSQLGPDLCLPEPDFDEIVRRATAPEHARRAIAELLLDQRVAAGIGNVFKCELLFLHRLDPWQPAGEVDAVTMREVYVRAAKLLRDNLLTSRRTTVPRALRAPPGRRDRTPGAGFWVYKRTRRPCRQCGVAIKQTRMGEQARLTWWCPHCQARPTSPEQAP
jgi:endonuclease VIII